MHHRPVEPGTCLDRWCDGLGGISSDQGGLPSPTPQIFPKTESSEPRAVTQDSRQGQSARVISEDHISELRRQDTRRTVIPLGVKPPHHSADYLPRETPGTWGGTKDRKGFTSTQTGTESFRSYIWHTSQPVFNMSSMTREGTVPPVLSLRPRPWCCHHCDTATALLRRSRPKPPGFPGGSRVGVHWPMQEVWFRSLGREDPLEEEMPPQYSCLENPVDRGAGRATLCGVSESDTTDQLRTSTSSGMFRQGVLTFSF